MWKLFSYLIIISASFDCEITNKIRVENDILRLTFKRLTISFQKSRMDFARNYGNKTETGETQQINNAIIVLESIKCY
jgi:hypothetical protein